MLRRWMEGNRRDLTAYKFIRANSGKRTVTEMAALFGVSALQVGETREVVAATCRGHGTPGIDPLDSGKAQKAVRQPSCAPGATRDAREARQPEEGGAARVRRIPGTALAYAGTSSIATSWRKGRAGRGFPSCPVSLPPAP